MPRRLQTETISDFSGGITDFVLKAPKNKSHELVNVLVDDNNSLVTRPGSERYLYLPVNLSNFPITSIYNNEGFRYFISGGKLYEYSEHKDEYNECGNVIGGDQRAFSWARILYHNYFTGDGVVAPQKVYLGSDGRCKVTQVGLPFYPGGVEYQIQRDPEWDKVEFLVQAGPDDTEVEDRSGRGRAVTQSSGISLEAGGVFSKYVKSKDTTDYFSIGDAGPLDLGSDDFTIDFRFKVSDIGSDYKTLCGQWQEASDNKSWRVQVKNDSIRYSYFDSDGNEVNGSRSIDIENDAWYNFYFQRRGGTAIEAGIFPPPSIHVGYIWYDNNVASDLAFKNSTADVTFGGEHGGANGLTADFDRVRITKGLGRYPRSFSSVSAIFAQTLPFPEDRNFLPNTFRESNLEVAFRYEARYEASGRNFLVLGPANFVDFGGSWLTLDGGSISDIVPLANTSHTNYDLDSIRLKVYYKPFGINTYYEVADLPSHFEGEVGVKLDEPDLNKPMIEPLEVADFDPPPRAKYVHAVGNVMHYAHLNEGGNYNPNALVEAIADEPDHVNGANRLVFSGEITGINSIRDSLIVFTKDSVYRKDGFYRPGELPRLTQIDATHGTISNNSIVKVKNVLFYLSPIEVCMCDGDKVTSLGGDLLERYREMLSNYKGVFSSINGTYDHVLDKVYWTFKDVGGEDIILCLHLKKGFFDGSSRDASLTIMKGRDFTARSLAYDDGVGLLRGSADGAILRHSDAFTFDEDRGGMRSPVKFFIRTKIFDFDFQEERKHVPILEGQLSSKTDINIDLRAYNDNQGDARHLSSVLGNRGGWVWGDDGIRWLVTDIGFGRVNLVRFFRRFPSDGGLKLNTIQLELESARSLVWEGEVVIFNGNINKKDLTPFERLGDLIVSGGEGEIGLVTDDYEKRYEITDSGLGWLRLKDNSINYSGIIRVYTYNLGERLKLDWLKFKYSIAGKSGVDSGQR